MVCLEFELRAAGWYVRMKPWSYGWIDEYI